MSTVVAYVPDLMDRSKVAAAVPGATFVPTVAALGERAAGAGIVVVDLGRPGVIDLLGDLAASGARVVGFASHVDRATLDTAAAAGCRAYRRSEFFSRIAAIVGG